MTLAMETDRRDRGFSLVELLVVIVVLGILATVVVFAVRGLADRGDSSACDSDQRTVIHAMEARLADRGSYASEATLQSEGFLRSESSLHDVTLNGADYEVVAVGACAGVTSATTTVGGPSGTSSTLPPIASTLFPTNVVGNGAFTVLILGYGVPPSQLPGMENWCVTSGNLTCTFLQTGNSVVKVEDLINNLIAHPSMYYFDYTYDGPITVFQQDGVTPVVGSNSTLHDFLVGAFGVQVISGPPPSGPPSTNI